MLPNWGMLLLSAGTQLTFIAPKEKWLWRRNKNNWMLNMQEEITEQMASIANIWPLHLTVCAPWIPMFLSSWTEIFCQSHLEPSDCQIYWSIPGYHLLEFWAMLSVWDHPFSPNVITLVWNYNCLWILLLPLGIIQWSLQLVFLPPITSQALGLHRLSMAHVPSSMVMASVAKYLLMAPKPGFLSGLLTRALEFYFKLFTGYYLLDAPFASPFKRCIRLNCVWNLPLR